MWLFGVSIAWVAILSLIYLIPAPPIETRFLSHPGKYIYRGLALCVASWYCTFAGVAIVIFAYTKDEDYSLEDTYGVAAILSAGAILLFVVIEQFIQPCRESLLCCKCCCCYCCCPSTEAEASLASTCARCFCNCYGDEDEDIERRDRQGTFQHHALSVVLTALFASVVQPIVGKLNWTHVSLVYVASWFVLLVLQSLIAAWLATKLIEVEFSLAVSGGISFAAGYLVRESSGGILNQDWAFYFVLVSTTVGGTLVNICYNWWLHRFFGAHQDVKQAHEEYLRSKRSKRKRKQEEAELKKRAEREARVGRTTDEDDAAADALLMLAPKL